MPATWTDPLTGKTFFTGPVDANGIASFLSPRHKLCAMIPHIAVGNAPAQLGYFPKYRSNFGNDRFGDCVSAEEAYAKSCYGYEIPEQTVIDWARQHGELNGADLSTVCGQMAQKGFTVGPQLYNDGPASTVDWTNDEVIRSALVTGPVKIAMAAASLPSGAGSHDGWFSLTARSRNTDHCTTITAAGPAAWIFQQLGVSLPAGLPGDTYGYGLYTWSTIGFVTPAWVKGTTDEALLRNPTNIGVPPLTPPTPPIPPGPSPLPVIQGTLTVAGGQMTLPSNLLDGSYVLFPKTII